MSTIASPRPSITLSSRRTSIETTTSDTSKPPASGTAGPERGSLRRNRTALRDYYNLKKDAESSPKPPTLDTDQESELDKPGFNADTYVANLLANEGLEGVLRVEAGLVSDIRSLDGEKKALVYDNYSKLITATDTIRSMREKMDPLTPTTSTLTPAIGHIAETASGLMSQLKREHAEGSQGLRGRQVERRRQQELVRWVLATPDRMRQARQEGNERQAREHWEKASNVLDKWQGVKGVDGVRQACLAALDGQEAG